LDCGLPPEFLLNEPVLNGVFGTHAKDLMIELSKPFSVNPKIDQLKLGIDFSLLNGRAKRWLEKQPEK
jgi:hypothetical protein